MLASLQDAGPFFQRFPVVSLALNHRLARFDASGIGTIILSLIAYQTDSSVQKCGLLK